MATTGSLSVQPGPDAFNVVPDSTLAVARTAYKNNSSKYTINGRASNYKEVQMLLKGRGIDLDHNRFLILQVGFLLPVWVLSHSG
jgi:structural maintenance of chromosome 4